MKNKKVLGTIVALAFLGTSGCCTLKNKTLFEQNIDGKADVKYELVNSPLECRSFDPDYKLTIKGKGFEWVMIDDNRDGRINLEADDYASVKVYDESGKLRLDQRFGKSNPDQYALESMDRIYVAVLDELQNRLPEGEKDKIPKPNTH